MENSSFQSLQGEIFTQSLGARQKTWDFINMMSENLHLDLDLIFDLCLFAISYSKCTKFYIYERDLNFNFLFRVQSENVKSQNL